VALPLQPVVPPQLARPKPALPDGDDWVYEPKYDGFRAIVFVDGEETYLQSRNGRPLSRYFPELAFPAGRYVLDGEIVVKAEGGGEAFGDLQQRLHPAESRVQRLAKEIPATFIAFDLLARDDEVLMERPWRERRAALEAMEGLELAPVVETAAEAEPWLQTAEGVIAKQAGAPYKPGERTGMVKVRRLRTLDAVVRGYRPGKEPETVGSLILALYDGDQLREVGHTSGLKAAEKRKLFQELKAYENGERGHGEPSRWKSAEEMMWIGLRPELVVEVSYDHASDGRIRHGTKLLRWRDDKPPRECTYDQLS
jgi:ATP-dependent DNA ligase